MTDFPRLLQPKAYSRGTLARWHCGTGQTSARRLGQECVACGAAEVTSKCVIGLPFFFLLSTFYALLVPCAMDIL